MKIETEHQLVNAEAEEIFNFLTDFNNFEKLLPEDKIENWNSTSGECSFRIKGMTDIGMKIENTQPHSLINVISYHKVPFNFTLDIHLNGVENGTNAYCVFNGDVNPFMKMMVEKPLTNFFNMLVSKLVSIYS